MRKGHPMTRTHMMIRSAFSLLPILVLSAGITAVAQTSTVHYSYDQPVSNQAYTNDCNGEMVMMNGTMHFEYFYSTDADSDHTDYHITSSTKLTGVGVTTGAQYMGNNSTNYHTVTHGAVASDFSSTEKTRLVAQGSTPDMTLRQTVHVVVDPHGNIHADTSNQKISCK
jgi:hypothetical protein